MKNLDSLKIASKFLKSQREKKEFTIEEVCIELKLDKDIILDIENGNFDNFKNYLFLKGYVRNYANFLGVQVSLPEVEIKKNKKVSNRKKPSWNLIGNKKKYIYLITFLIFILMLSTFSNKNKNLEYEISSSSIDAKNTDIEKKENNIPIKTTDLKSNTAHKESKNIQDINMDENKILLEKSSDSDDNPSSNNDNSENISIEPIHPVNDVFLEITYKGDSWTEIIDSKGDIIFFDLVKRGKTIKFNILAPFEILLGDATVVNIKYNNKLISIPYFNPDTNVGKIKIKK